MRCDHTANANDYASATWLVQEVERDRMFAQPAPSSFSTYSDLNMDFAFAGTDEADRAHVRAHAKAASRVFPRVCGWRVL